MISIARGVKLAALLLAGLCGLGVASARAETYPPIPPSLTTPDQVETSIGTLKFRDGIPDQATADKVYDQLDLQRGVSAFLNGLRGVSILAARNGIRAAGVKDNEGVLIFSGLMDAQSLFLTANADTIYFLGNIDLSKGPMVVETPPDTLGLFDDLWFRWVIDFGAPGPDRGQGGKYLLLPPGYDGPLPEGGYFIGRPTTTSVALLGRAFLIDNDPKPAVETIKRTLKIYPYVPGSYGTSIGSFVTGKAPLAPLSKPGTLTFVEGTGLSMNTIPPNDFSYYEMLDALVQEQPAEALEPEIGGQFAAIGIVKGKKFAPDERMKKILTDAIAIANAAGRTIAFTPRESEGFGYYSPTSKWLNPLFVSGYDFMRPPPEITKEGVKQFPYTGAHTLDARAAFFYVATGVTPAMIMRLPNVGSQYLFGIVDSSGKPFDGAKTYKVTLPPNIPAAKFWSFTLYDNQTRSMLQTPQRFPAPAARAIRRPRPRLMRTVRPPSISARTSRTACRTAISFRRYPAKVGS